MLQIWFSRFLVRLLYLPRNSRTDLSVMCSQRLTLTSLDDISYSRYLLFYKFLKNKKRCGPKDWVSLAHWLFVTNTVALLDLLIRSHHTQTSNYLYFQKPFFFSCVACSNFAPASSSSLDEILVGTSYFSNKCFHIDDVIHKSMYSRRNYQLMTYVQLQAMTLLETCSKNNANTAVLCRFYSSYESRKLSGSLQVIILG